MKKICQWIAITIVLIILLILLNHKSNDAPIKIGISTVLSGDFAVAGENMVRSAQIAIDEINSEGGIKGREVVLISEDAGTTSTDGLNAAHKLVDIDKVDYIIGGTSSNGTLAAAPFVNDKEVIYNTCYWR